MRLSFQSFYFFVTLVSLALYFSPFIHAQNMINSPSASTLINTASSPSSTSTPIPISSSNNNNNNNNNDKNSGSSTGTMGGGSSTANGGSSTQTFTPSQVVPIPQVNSPIVNRSIFKDNHASSLMERGWVHLLISMLAYFFLQY